MTTPQLENGYTRIANELMDALIAFGLSGQEIRVALLVIRKTYGFNKIEDIISLSQITKATGMSKVRASQVVNRLQLMKLLTVTENINGISKKYKFNKDFCEWCTVNENLNCYIKTKETVKEKRKRPLRFSVTTKDTITKDTITKENLNPYSPEFLSFWIAYPKKSGSKKAAFDNWQKLSGGRPTIEIILEAIRKQIEWRKNAGGKFRPEWKDPERWIKGKMWEVELTEENKSSW